MRDFKLWEVVFNPPLVGALLAMASAQFFKAMIKPLFRGKLPDLRRISDYGGFPSGHTAFIVACAAGVGVSEGFRSPLFGLAAVTAAILVYDIIKLRKTVEVTWNETKRLLAEQGLEPAVKPPQFRGHSIPEVIGGGIWGLACAVLSSFIPFP
jgi:uncharacterized protein